MAIEPINRYETFLVNIAEDGLRFIAEVNFPAVKIHLDVFHMNIEELNLMEVIRCCGKLLINLHIADMAEKLENKFIFSLKPNPSYLARPNIDEDFTRQYLKSVLKSTADCCLEIILKDTSTIFNNVQNIIKWCKIAREEIESIKKFK